MHARGSPERRPLQLALAARVSSLVSDGAAGGVGLLCVRAAATTTSDVATVVRRTDARHSQEQGKYLANTLSPENSLQREV